MLGTSGRNNIEETANLNEVRRDKSHGAVIGVEGLIKLRHCPAFSKGLLRQVEVEAVMCRIRISLHGDDGASRTETKAVNLVVLNVFFDGAYMRFPNKRVLTPSSPCTKERGVEIEESRTRGTNTVGSRIGSKD